MFLQALLDLVRQFWWLLLLVIVLQVVKIASSRKRRVERRLNYAVYLQTPEWARKRSMVLKRDHYRCHFCGAKAHQVHHLRYARDPGNEPIEWLVAICEPCHLDQHSIGQANYSKTQ